MPSSVIVPLVPEARKITASHSIDNREEYKFEPSRYFWGNIIPRTISCSYAMVDMSLKSECSYSSHGSPSSSSSSSLSSRRRRTTIRFDLSHREIVTTKSLQPSCNHLVNGDDEIRALLWWTKSETDQMKANAETVFRFSLLQAHTLIASNQTSAASAFEDSRLGSVDSIRHILAKSTLDDTDIEIMSKVLSQKLGINEKHPGVLNGKAQRRMNGARRVVQVQKFLNQQNESSSRKAELLRIASLYHSESSTSLALVIGEVDAMAAAKVFQGM